MLNFQLWHGEAVGMVGGKLAQSADMAAESLRGGGGGIVVNAAACRLRRTGWRSRGWATGPRSRQHDWRSRFAAAIQIARSDKDDPQFTRTHPFDCGPSFGGPSGRGVPWEQLVRCWAVRHTGCHKQNVQGHPVCLVHGDVASDMTVNALRRAAAGVREPGQAFEVFRCRRRQRGS